MPVDVNGVKEDRGKLSSNSWLDCIVGDFSFYVHHVQVLTGNLKLNTLLNVRGSGCSSSIDHFILMIYYRNSLKFRKKGIEKPYYLSIFLR